MAVLTPAHDAVLALIDWLPEDVEPRTCPALAEGTVHRTPTSCGPAVPARGREDTVGSSTRLLAARRVDLLAQNTKLT